MTKEGTIFLHAALYGCLKEELYATIFNGSVILG